LTGIAKIEDWCFDYHQCDVLDFSGSNLDRAAWVAVMGAKSVTVITSGDVNEVTKELHARAEGNQVIRAELLQKDYDSAISNVKPGSVEICKIIVLSEPSQLDSHAYDIVFFDVDDGHEIKSYADLTAAVHLAREALKPSGHFYLACRIAIISTEWDICNSIAFAADGTYLPSSHLLYNDILAKFSVRPLVRIPERSVPQGPKKVYRCAPLKPILILIYAVSQGGKTTVSRALSRKNANAHVSCDFVYNALLTTKKNNFDTIEDKKFVQYVKTNRWEDVGDFFRSLDDDHEALEDFIKFIAPMIPLNDTYSTLEIDLRKPASIALAKKIFDELGLSVWEMHR